MIDIKKEMKDYISKRANQNNDSDRLLDSINKKNELFSQLIEKYFKHNRNFYLNDKEQFLDKGLKYLKKKFL